MNGRLKQIIFNKLDKDLGCAEIIVDDLKSIWFIDRADKFWYLELRSSGTLWWRYSFFKDFFLLFGLERLEYEPVIAEWVEEVLKREVSSTNPNAYLNNLPVEEVLKRGVSSTQLGDIGTATKIRQVLKRHVYSTQCNVGLQGSRPVEEVLKPKTSPTSVDNLSALVTMEEALKLHISSFLNFDTPRNREVGRALTRRVNSTDAKYILPHWELDKVLQIKIQPEETNVKRVLSLKAGVRECKMKIKKILKKIIT